MKLDILLNQTLQEFLLQCVSDKIEELPELPVILKDIEYLDNKEALISQTTCCEILDTENAAIEHYEKNCREIHIQYGLNFILQTLIHDEFTWRVQGYAQAEFTIPASRTIDWSVFAVSTNFWTQYEKHKRLVRFQRVTYVDVECDSLYL